jgi:hypothetical protein
MLAKAPADRHQTPIDLIADLAEILEELDAPLPFAATTLPWTMPPRTVPRWRQHAVWAIPLAALIALGLAADRLTRVSVAVDPFPALQPSAVLDTAPAAPSMQLDQPAPLTTPPQPTTTIAPMASVVAPPPLGVSSTAQPSLGASPPLDLSSNEAPAPFSLDESWERSKSLWDVVSNWQTPPESPPSLSPNALQPLEGPVAAPLEAQPSQPAVPPLEIVTPASAPASAAPPAAVGSDAKP